MKDELATRFQLVMAILFLIVLILSVVTYINDLPMAEEILSQRG